MYPIESQNLEPVPQMGKSWFCVPYPMVTELLTLREWLQTSINVYFTINVCKIVIELEAQVSERLHSKEREHETNNRHNRHRSNGLRPCSGPREERISASACKPDSATPRPANETHQN